MASFVGTTNRDVFAGLEGENNLFTFTSLTLSINDVLTGSSGIGDVLNLNAGGTISAASTTGVSRIEYIMTANSGLTSLVITDRLARSSDSGALTILTGAGGGTIDASAVGAEAQLFVRFGSGRDSFLGGASRDTLLVAAGGLNGLDSFTGGSGFDTLIFETTASATASNFSNTSGVEALALYAGGSVQVTDAIWGDGLAAVYGNNSNDAVDATLMTRDVLMRTGGGNDVNRGGTGNDQFYFDNGQLTSGDTVAGGAGADTLFLVSGGTVTAADLQNVSGLEQVVLIEGTSISLTAGMTDGAAITVYGSSGSDQINGAGLGTKALVAYSDAGTDAITGGGGNDIVVASAADLTAADTLAGGAGADILMIRGAADVEVADLANVTGFEYVALENGGSIKVGDSIVASANGRNLGIAGNAATADTLDASAVVNGANAVTLYGTGGQDTMIGGAGADTILVTDMAFQSVDGRGGFDRLKVYSNDLEVDLSAARSRLAGLEVVDLTGFGTSVLTIADADVSQISSGQNFLYIIGDASVDQLDVGSGWTLIATGHTNANLAGYAFTHIRKNGVDLFLQSDLPFTGAIPFETAQAPVLALDNPSQNYTVPTAYRSGDAGVSVVGPSFTLADANAADNIASATVRIVNPLTAGENLSLTATGAGFAAALGIAVASTNAGATLTFTGNATPAQFQQLLREVVYFNPDQSAGLVTTARTIQFQATDNTGLASAVATSTLSIVRGNADPTVAAASFAATEDATFIGTIAASDADGDALTFTLVSGPGNGALTLNPNGQFTYIPNGNFSGGDSFVVTVNDGLSTSAPATITINVGAVNETRQSPTPTAVW